MRTLAEWLALHESVHPKTIDMDLTRVTAVAQALGLTTPAFRVMTVAGTNGKGSTVAHADALLRALGAATGMFISPHFLRYNERIRVGGAEVGDAELIAAFERIEAARGATTLTFFEFNTLAALCIFTARKVDVGVLEVGLGGRLDATNLLAADVAVLTSVGFDHRDYLGDTLELIGAEKAGIFRAQRPAVLGTPDMPPSVYARIAALPARALIAGRDFSWQMHADGWSYRGLGVTLEELPAPRLAGSIQYRNAATALAAVEALGLP
ncbi:MAG: Mur ligase family protein, partial [Steroidobacteraceae bacterium]